MVMLSASDCLTDTWRYNNDLLFLLLLLLLIIISLLLLLLLLFFSLQAGLFNPCAEVPLYLQGILGTRPAGGMGQLRTSFLDLWEVRNNGTSLVYEVRILLCKAKKQ